MMIRRARDTDLEVVGEITVAAYADFVSGPDDTYLAKLRDAAAREREAELWVATLGARVLGSVTLCPDGSPWREIARGDEGEFRMLSVAPDAQRMGVGEALVRHCLDRSRETGRTGMVLSSLPEMTAAHRVYARFGFVRTPERDWSPQVGVDLWAFATSF
jgi:ribosomal protein S18 acetylase RimI-like enzyme